MRPMISLLVALTACTAPTDATTRAATGLPAPDRAISDIHIDDESELLPTSTGGLYTTAGWTKIGTIDDYIWYGRSAAAGDVNGDGHIDVLVGAQGYEGMIVWIRKLSNF